jgi:RIO kinase 1
VKNPLKIPQRLQALYQAELIDDVVGRLQSGKEADVYLVHTADTLRCAKVYKEAHSRSFKQKSLYTEGRKVRNSRQARAMAKGSRFGKQESEEAWMTTEVEALSLLASVGVRVPKAYTFYEGVLLLELVTDAEGDPAPRLHDIELTPALAREFHDTLMREVVRMLCAGLVHGDLSEFNVLVAHDGLVIIDFPQVVQATSNNAFSVLERDLKQLAAFFGREAPELLETRYAKEIWKLYQNGTLKPDSVLSGIFVDKRRQADIKGVLEEIEGAREDALEKRGIKKPPSFR